MSDQKENPKVQVFHRVNRLKIKAGSTVDGPPVKFSKERLKNPELFMEKHTENYDEEIENVLNDLEKAWTHFLSDDQQTVDKGRDTLYHKANHAKDLAATCNYPLMQHFGLSLREFVENIDPSLKEHQTIVRAHLDVMWTTKKEDIRGHGGEKAEELKDVVKVAIERFGGK